MPPKGSRPKGTRGSTKQKLTDTQTDSAVASELGVGKKPIPLKSLAPVESPGSTAATTERGRAQRTTRQAVDYHALDGRPPPRRSGAEVTAEKKEKVRAREQATQQRQASIEEFAAFENDVESKDAQSRKEAANPPICSQVKRRQRLSSRSKPPEAATDSDSDEGSEEINEVDEDGLLAEYEGSTATTPATTDFDGEDGEDEEESFAPSRRSSRSRKSIRSSDLDEEEEAERFEVENDREAAMEVDEPEVLVAVVREPRTRVKKGVQVRTEVESSRVLLAQATAAESHAADPQPPPTGRKRASTVTQIHGSSSSKKAKKDKMKKADAGARPGFVKSTSTLLRHSLAPPPPQNISQEMHDNDSNDDNEEEDEGFQEQYGGFQADDDDEETERRDVRTSNKNAKGAGAISMSMAKVEQRLVAPARKPMARTKAKELTQADLPESLKEHWPVLQATLVAFVATTNDRASPFVIDNPVEVIKKVFNHVYSSSRSYAKNIGPKEVVYELSLNCIRNWHTKFRTQSTTVLEDFFATFSNPDAIEAYVACVAPNNDDLDDDMEPEPMTFHWRQYDNKGKRGSYENPLLLKILASHLQAIASADVSWFNADKPIWVLVLSLVAHERGLMLWQDGTFDKDQQKIRMSDDNWGDVAANYFTAVKPLSDGKWAKIMAGTRKFCTVSRARRAISGRGGSAASMHKAKAREIVEESDPDDED
ncbi:hypothetical protein OF83DRAFT_1088886 [Amylostereum chailletii]|nr:hypothetical protein OF83DRAFT_1088886 [Amylostereum chailletii]